MCVVVVVLRSKVIKWLQKNQDWHGFCAPRTPRRYIQDMKRPTEFFDNIALTAAGAVLNVNVHIFTSEQMVPDKAQMQIIIVILKIF